MPKAKVKVISETPTGLNNRVSINGTQYTNNQAYNKAVRGEVPGYHGVKNSDGTKFIRSNPDGNKNNNLDH
ncbi:DUF3892 domain-containing protein [Dielma fastidiosa]|uniref:DUF3892 domain-containing protein n=1 Tax=Dielma fastidiosa TaxID=1034346 RepID=UPI001C7136B9|nr:DUF3892 domain-containing protein [Dielma fastidiosa]